jgi:hypothetical protein
MEDIHFRVFAGPPSTAELQQSGLSYNWQTISSTSSIVFPQATLQAASRRISLIYQNIIFNDSNDLEQVPDENISETDAGTTIYLAPDYLSANTYLRLEPTSWLPTASRSNLQGQSFLSCSVSHAQSFQQTQETQDTTYSISDACSITRFPAFQFSLHSLTPLSALSTGKGSRKISVLLAALEVEGPDTIKIKRGADAGRDVSILKMILGDQDGMVCKLTAWREIAETWGGMADSRAVKRGDVVLIDSTHVSMVSFLYQSTARFISDVLAAYDPSASPTLTASPYLKSRLEICFRTMPYTHADKYLRPDLRLGNSDAGVRKVASIVNWFQRMAGLTN